MTNLGKQLAQIEATRKSLDIPITDVSLALGYRTPTGYQRAVRMPNGLTHTKGPKEPRIQQLAHAARNPTLFRATLYHLWTRRNSDTQKPSSDPSIASFTSTLLTPKDSSVTPTGYNALLDAVSRLTEAMPDMHIDVVMKVGVQGNSFTITGTSPKDDA